MYYILNIKMQGWWMKTSTWGSDFSAIKSFTHEQALDFCKKRFTNSGLEVVPVAVADIEAVRAK